MTAPDLPAFLLARIAEDEEVARSAYYEGQRWLSEEEDVVRWPEDELVHIASRKRDAAHIARHDPARVLADCAAARDVLTLLRRYEGAIRQESAVAKPGDRPPTNLYAARDALLEAARLLAQPHAAHPDFDPSWRV